ncbi:hypothetical protein Pmar_PMAR005178, partial [Perkinsus marinus ATCC 50983]
NLVSKKVHDSNLIKALAGICDDGIAYRRDGSRWRALGFKSHHVPTTPSRTHHKNELVSPDTPIRETREGFN